MFLQIYNMKVEPRNNYDGTIMIQKVLCNNKIYERRITNFSI